VLSRRLCSLVLACAARFGNPKGEGYIEHLGSDGLPEVGSKLTQGMALWRAVLPLAAVASLPRAPARTVCAFACQYRVAIWHCHVWACLEVPCLVSQSL
jgi:hypothetical protein